MVDVRPKEPADEPALAAMFRATWGGTVVAARGVAFDLTTSPTLVAVEAGTIVGALTYDIDDDAMEVISVEAALPGLGVGGELLRAAIAEARDRGLRRLWLITTNDNLDAIRLYQRRGLRIIRVRPDAVDHARRLKPRIPAVGSYDLPMRDELTLELRLNGVPRKHRDVWSLLAHPADAADAVRALALPHLGLVDAVTWTGGEAGLALATLVAADLAVPLVPRAGERVLVVDPTAVGDPTG
jgi:ribosomal protein S18 acetylase RimI-like enzyme